MPSPLGEKVLAAIRAGKATNIESLAEAMGVDRRAATDALTRLRVGGFVTYEKLHLRAIDWTTVAVVGEKRAKVSKRTAKAKPSKAATSPDGLEDCTSVTYQPEEIAALVELEGTLRVALDKVSEVVRALQASPRLGPKGAAAMRLIATLMTEAK
jgi:hypothetical protein